MVVNKNLFVVKEQKSFAPTTLSDTKISFGVDMVMGYCHYPRIRRYKATQTLT